jgi:ketosteroid isomerase-like protein
VANEDADKSSIESLIREVAHLADNGSADEYITLFSDNAIWKLGSTSTLTGRQAIYDAAVDRRKQRITGPDSDTRHDVTPGTVSLFGDTADAYSQFEFYSSISIAPRLDAKGCYRDKFVRTAEGWKMTYRDIEWEPVESGT